MGRLFPQEKNILWEEHFTFHQDKILYCIFWEELFLWKNILWGDHFPKKKNMLWEEHFISKKYLMGRRIRLEKIYYGKNISPRKNILWEENFI